MPFWETILYMWWQSRDHICKYIIHMPFEAQIMQMQEDAQLKSS